MKETCIELCIEKNVDESPLSPVLLQLGLTHTLPISGTSAQHYTKRELKDN